MVHVPLTFLSEWREFPSVPCHAGKKKTWWMQASRYCWNRAGRLTCFLWASVTRKNLQFANEQTPLSNDTIDFVLRHRELGRAKDLPAPPRMSVTATRPCLRRSSRNSQILNGVACTSLVMNFTQIGQEGNSLTPRRRVVCQCASSHATQKHSINFVDMCRTVHMGQIMSPPQQNFIYSIEYSLFSTAPNVTKRAVTCRPVWNCCQLENCWQHEKQLNKFLMCIL
jgi:hypothetical protein